MTPAEKACTERALDHHVRVGNIRSWSYNAQYAKAGPWQVDQPFHRYSDAEVRGICIGLALAASARPAEVAIGH